MSKVNKFVKSNQIIVYNVLVYVVVFLVFQPLTIWIWPYPLLLTLITPWETDGPGWLWVWSSGFVLAWILGASIAYAVARVFQKRSKTATSWASYGWTPIVWLALLILMELVLFFFVSVVLGLTVGE
jgi:hypothetical protein